MGVKGWIKNTSDGKVDLVAQGDNAVISKMKNMINNQFYEKFSSIDLFEEKANKKYEDFSILE